MTHRLTLALAFHNHQPVGNFGWVVEEAYERAYLPMLGALERHGGIRLALHYSGPLLEWLRAEQPSFLERLAALVARGQVELLGGGLYEPVLASLPEQDRHSQLVRMADAIEGLGGQRPAGAWLAERVWEPSLPATLADAGYRYTIVDDAHFRAASVEEHALSGSYLTEDQGRPIALLGSDKELRYRVPFGTVKDVIALLRGRATDDGRHLAFMGDDGEKFGSWPSTFEHCWGRDAWVERFFEAIEASRAWLAMVPPGEWIERERPIGRIYLPTASYAEMGEWALPPEQSREFAHLVHAAEARHDPVRRYLRGGYWRSFQVRYREINDLHKQMLRASAKVAAMPGGNARERAEDHLHRGQSNDCYWHGIFGGIYLSHLRSATSAELIAAEDAADRAARARGEEVDGIRLVDTDADGIDEVLVTSPGQVVVIDLAEGAGVGTWDVRPVRHALASVLRRRPEAYHARLIESEQGTAGPTSTGAASIHEGVRVREPGLGARVRYDTYERRGGLVHLLAPRADRGQLAAGSTASLDGSVDGPFELVRLGESEVVTRRDARLRAGEAAGEVITIEKRFRFDGDRRSPSITLDVSVTSRSRGPVAIDLAVEWPVMLLGGGANPDAWYEVGPDRFRHDSTGESANVAHLGSGNTWLGLEIAHDLEPAATVWWWPIETVSNSEAGFERTYQGSALVAVWPLRLAPGGGAAVRMTQRVSSAFDRAEAEGD